VPDYRLIGHDYTLPDLVAKVTGQAKYSEDVRADGMLYCRLLRSPMPHAEVRGIDSRDALRVPGVKAILTPDDLPPHLSNRPSGQVLTPQPALAREPLFEGEPVLAIAAVDEAAAVAALEKVKVDYRALPFVLDPLETLRPGSPNARAQGNVLVGNRIVELKWTEADFAGMKDGQMPMGQVSQSEHWTSGDVEAGLSRAALVLDESFAIENTYHIPLETRSALAYWQNGRVYVYCSTQSLAQTVPAIAYWAGVDQSQVVVISEYTGGAFGGKNPAHHYVAIPILLAKKTGQPVMLRITRDDETAIGPTRPGMIGRARMGFARDGHITALDLFLVGDAGSYGVSDHVASSLLASLLYQPDTMRFRGITVLTNTRAHGAQRGPGMQFIPIVEQVISKAARRLGIDQVAIRRANAPAGKASLGPTFSNGVRNHITMANVRQALDRGAELFKWSERTRAPARRGSTVRGIGVAVGTFVSGVVGYDGLMVLKPDGRLYVQSGCGHLGTNSTYDTARAAAEVLGMLWEKVVVTQGDSSKHVPFSCPQSGSATTHAHTRANWAAGSDARQKLKEIAARDLGGTADDYDIGSERVFRRGSPARGLTYAEAAARAIALGGAFDGHSLPSNINPMTTRSATALAGLGLMGVARDSYPRDGDTWSFVAGFAEVEVDVETGTVHVSDYVAVADCGTVLHPRNCRGQAFGGTMLGLAHALYHREIFDRQLGVSLGTRFYQLKPATILDAPEFQFAALNIPDPGTPVGARGIGEPPCPAAYAAVINALIDAIGDEAFRRAPVTPDIILASIEAKGKWAHEALTLHL
jgi:xanthine dehydrogenase molybdenum-binding subunit